jgi:hypothetical protein
VKPSFDEKAFIAEVRWNWITIPSQFNAFLWSSIKEAPVGSIVFQALTIDLATPNGRLTYKFHVDGTLGCDHAFLEMRKFL